MIYLPYRNGILHGRDLNYDNIFCLDIWFFERLRNQQIICLGFYLSSQLNIVCDFIERMEDF